MKKPLPSIKENLTGLHQRFVIRKVTGVKDVKNKFGDIIGERLVTKPVDDNAEYFVLRLDLNGKDSNHIAACRKAIHTYADAIEPTIPKLAKDLRERYPLH